MAAEKERLLKSLYEDALARGKKAGFDRLRRALRLNTEVGLGCSERVNDGSVCFGASVRFSSATSDVTEG